MYIYPGIYTDVCIQRVISAHLGFHGFMTESQTEGQTENVKDSGGYGVAAGVGSAGCFEFGMEECNIEWKLQRDLKSFSRAYRPQAMGFREWNSN